MKEKKAPIVSVVMGSDSDLPVMGETIRLLKDFAVPHEVFLTSAHRSPERTSSFAKKASQRGIRVIVVGAGAAAHLAGVIASQSILPVIGVPIDATPLGGMDALLSTAQMPGGIPVAAMSIGKAAKRLIHAGKIIEEGLLNRIEMAFRLYDPCLSCATHSLPGAMPLEVRIRNHGGEVIRTLRREG